MGKFAFALVSEVVLVPIVLIGGFLLELGSKRSRRKRYWRHNGKESEVGSLRRC